MRNIKDIKLDIPYYPMKIISTLKASGYDAYIVGGCVRDELLNKSPSDFDITTNAKPYEVKKLFKRTIDTGIKHGTISILFYENNEPKTFEVTTYRLDGNYKDNRHPENVVFVDELKEDLLRRDFTINAMAYNHENGLVDEFGGLVDLEKKIIRAVGNPIERFSEDALRLLRAIRFSAKLGFEIDSETKDAIPKLASNLQSVSKERVQVELTKTITSDNPEYVEMVFNLGLSKYICNSFDLIVPGMFVSGNKKNYLAYSSLLYNTNIEIAKTILQELKLDNHTINNTITILTAKSFFYEIKNSYDKKSFDKADILIKRLINYLKYELVFDYLELLKVNENCKSVIEYIERKTYEFKASKTPIYLQELNIGGNDLIEIGFVRDEVGLALKELLDIVHMDEKLNKKNILQHYAKIAYNSYKGGENGL